VKIDDRLGKRFKELDDQMRGLPSSRSSSGGSLSLMILLLGSSGPLALWGSSVRYMAKTRHTTIIS
jgi:hypothetical protein